MRMTCILVRGCSYLNLNTYELGAICIAAMCHDIAHPGKNNSFEAKINSPLAIRYNDKSIYENMHAATTFEILSDPACDVFATLTLSKKSEIRKMMIQSILMTDMASHFTLAKQLEVKVTGDITEGGFEVTFDSTIEDKQLLLDLILHSSDIGAQCLPVPIANKWSQGVLEEFQLVHQAEKDAGVELTPFIVGLEDPLRAANCQFGFINFIVRPLWTNLVKIFSNEMAEELMTNLDNNIEYWKNQVDDNTPIPDKVEGEDGEEGEAGEEGEEGKEEKVDAKEEESTVVAPAPAEETSTSATEASVEESAATTQEEAPELSLQ